MGTTQMLIAPLLVTLALKVNALVGIDADEHRELEVGGSEFLFAVLAREWADRESRPGR